MQDIWLPPNTPNTKVVGMFAEEEHEYTDRDGRKLKRTVTVLRHKIPGSHDVSCSLCKDDDNGAKVKAEWSKAWDLYQKNKALRAQMPPPTPVAVELGLKGTPIEEADFLGKDRLAYYKDMGFLLIEQIRDMSDADCNNVGHGAKANRKKAAEYLKSRNG